MKIVIQRVKEANVTVDKKTVGEINGGLMLLVGVCQGDTKEIAEKMVEKIYKMRIFEDENGKTNLSSSDVNAEVLVVSQFTLCANCKKGNRPSFIEAGSPKEAEELYEYIISLCESRFTKTEKGVFGADMKVKLLNDGPFTIVLDSKEIL